MKLKLIGAMLVAGFTVGNLVAGRATKVADAIWVNDQLYGTVLTDTNFKSPPAHSTDVIFNFDGSGLSGQRSVAEVAPGDPGYNGGRWHVYAVSFTDAGLMEYDPDGNGVVNLELSNAEAVLDAADLGLLTISDTGIFFECPLLPSR